jgi:hypothetical protein
MISNQLRIKLELAALATVGIGGLLIGNAMINPSGAQKQALIALGSAGAGALTCVAVSALISPIGSLRLELGKAQSRVRVLEEKAEKDSQQAKEVAETCLQLQDAAAKYDAEMSEAIAKIKVAEKLAADWQAAGLLARKTAGDFNEQIKVLDAELKASELKQAQAIDSLKQEHDANLHREIKTALQPKLHRMYENYQKHIEQDAAELKEQQAIELGRYQSRVDELKAEIEALETNLAEVSTHRRDLTTAFESLVKTDLPDVQATFEREWLQNDQLLQNAIEQLRQKNAEMQQPRQFQGTTAIDVTGNRIIQHFAGHGVCLDAIESVSIPTGFRLRFKFDRTDCYAKLTEEEFDKRVAEPGLMGLSYAPLDFVFDARNFIVSVDITTVVTIASGSGKAETASEAIALASADSGNDAAFRALGCFPASEFENVIRDKFIPRVRVVAGSTGGKSPLMELISVAIAKQNQAELWLLNPLPGSPKDWFSVPGRIKAGSDGIQDEIAYMEAAHQELVKRRGNLGAKYKFIMICADEVNALARDYENLGTVLKDFYQFSDHVPMGLITAGQGANVSGVSGGAKKNGNASKLMEEDFQNATQVFTAQAAKVWLKKHHPDLLGKLTELEKLCSQLNDSEGLSARPKPGTKVVDRAAYRIALVVSPATGEPFFIQIPAYSFYADKLEGVSFPSGATVTAPYENQVALGLAASPDSCPSCGSKNTKVNKTLKTAIKRVCGDCKHYYNVPKSAALAG